MSDRLLHIGGDHHVFGYESGKDVLHGRLEVLHVFLDRRDDIVGSDIGGRDDGECSFEFLFDVIIIEVHGSLGIGKRNECECDGEYGNEECVVDHNGDYATDNHEEDGGCTGNRKLTAFACLFECISNAVELYCELTGFLFAFCRQYLISQCLLGRDKTHKVVCDLFGGELQHEEDSHGDQQKADKVYKGHSAISFRVNLESSSCGTPERVRSVCR